MEFFVIIPKTPIHTPGKTLRELITDCRILGSVLILTPMTIHFMVGQLRQYFSQPGGCGPRLSQSSLTEWDLFFPPRLPPAMGEAPSYGGAAGVRPGLSQSQRLCESPGLRSDGSVRGVRQNIARPIKRPEGSIISHNSSLKPSGRWLQKQKYQQPHADALADGMYREKVTHTPLSDGS